MSGNDIGTVIGGAIGFMVGGATGLKWGMTIGGIAGGLLMPDEVGIQDKEGPKLNNLKVTAATYGISIPRVYGAYRIGGNIIWANPIKEVMHQREEEVGKGGSESYTVTWYTYSIDMAIALCEGPITGIRKIWANSVKIYDISTGGITSDYRASNQASGPLTFYLGTNDQPIDWFLQANKTDSPAYRNVSYIVFNQFQLEKYGNRIPNITAEVVVDGNITTVTQVGPNATRKVTYCYDESQTFNSSNPVKQFHSLDYDTVLYEGITPGDIPSCKYIDAYKVSNSNFLLTYLGRFRVSDSANTVRRPAPVYTDDKNALVTYVHGGSFDNPYGSIEIYSLITSEILYMIVPPDYTEGGYTQNLKIGMYKNSTFVACERHDSTSQPIKKFFVGEPKIKKTEADPDYYLNQVKARIIYPVDNYTLSYFLGTKHIIYFYHRYGVKDSAVSFYYLKENSFTFIKYIPFNPSNDIIVITDIIPNMYVDEELNYCYFMSYLNGISTIHRINLITEELKEYILSGSDSSYYYSSFHFNDNIMRIYDSPNYKYIVLEALNSNNVSVSSICQDLFEKSNMLDYDLTETNTKLVDGFLIPNVASARSSISVLQSAYLFDLIESDWKIKSKIRGNTSIKQISSTDLGANTETNIEHRKRLDTELPAKVTIKYANKDIDYQNGSQSIIRIDGNSDNNITFELPIVLNDTSAKEICEINMYGSWKEKDSFAFSLPSSYIDINVGDVVTLEYENQLVDIRLTKIIITSDNILHCESVKDSIYTSNALGQDLTEGFLPTILEIPTGNNLVMLNAPTLDNALINSQGMYYGACGYTDSWKGSEVFKSKDQGKNYSSIGVILNPIINGKTVTVLPSGPNTIWDLTSSVEIALTSGSLLPSTIENILNGNQYAMVGNEVIQFVDVSENIDRGTFIISKLLRGRRGTEWAIGTHTKQEDFTLLNYDMSFDFATLNIERYYKSVTFGTYLEDAEEIKATYDGRNLIPFSPSEFSIITDNDYSDLISWARRDRYISGYMRTLPLSEDSENFTLEIYDKNNSLVRTENFTNEYQFNYTKQYKINDNLILGQDINYKIYQVGTNSTNGYETLLTRNYIETYYQRIIETATLFWRFNESNGSIIAYEEINGNDNLNIESGALLEQTGCLDNSNNKSIKTINSTISSGYLPFDGYSFTIIFWWNILETEDSCTIITIGETTSTDVTNFKLVRKSATKVFIGSSTFGTDRGFTFTIDPNQTWMQIAYATDPNLNPIRKFYINGEFYNEDNVGMNNYRYMMIGGTPVGGLKKYTVNVDEVIIYSGVQLSGTKIKEIYNLSKLESQ